VEKAEKISWKTIIISTIVVVVLVVLVILFYRLDGRLKPYCERHPDDTEKCLCDSRIFELDYENHWLACQEMKQYAENTDCDIFLKFSTCTHFREKTISDLNCTELFDYYEHGRQCEWSKCKYPDINSNRRHESYLVFWMMRQDCFG
jgi:hypothetical protein